MQLLVERRHLAPEPLHLVAEIGHRHVVAGAPELAHVVEAQLAGALVAEFHEALVVGPDGRRDGSPAAPGFEQLPVIPAAGHCQAQLLEVPAAIRAVGTVLAAAIGAFHARHDFRQLAALGVVVGRRQRRPPLDRIDGALRDRFELHAVVLPGAVHRFALELEAALLRAGGQQRGVRGDVGLVSPGGRRAFEAQFLVPIAGAADEFLGAHERRIVRGCANKNGQCQGRNDDSSLHSCSSSAGVMHFLRGLRKTARIRPLPTVVSTICQ